jgi:fatty-acyl-CoA synthase
VVAESGVGLVCGDEEWTWRQIVAEATRRAALLEQARVPGPFHVGVLLDNVAEYLFVLCAAGLGGAVVVGINSTRRGAELAADISHTDCQLILTDPAGVGLLAGLDLGLAPDRVWDVTGAEYASRLAGVGADPTVDVPVGPEDLYALLFTSGSSGAPRAGRPGRRRRGSVRDGRFRTAPCRCSTATRSMP